MISLIRGFDEDAGIVLVRPLIIVLALMNKMSWAKCTYGKDIVKGMCVGA
jgi:hypothetical protein